MKTEEITPFYSLPHFRKNNPRPDLRPGFKSLCVSVTCPQYWDKISVRNLQEKMTVLLFDLASVHV